MKKEMEKVLLGTTTDHEFVFADFGVTDRNGYDEFTASFFTVTPFRFSWEECADRFSALTADYDAESKLQLCDDYDCPPSRLAEEMIRVMDNNELMGCCYDTSLFPYFFRVGDEDYHFESRCCGQHDTRGQMDEYTRPALYLRIHQLWDEYHLKEITGSAMETFKIIADAAEEWNYYKNMDRVTAWITDRLSAWIDAGIVE